METLIQADNLVRRFGRRVAVNDVSFSLKQGEILGLLGRNGAGKSTTMQMLCGVLAPTSGTISINGIDLLSAPRLAKHHLGYLPDPPPLYRDATVNEFLEFCARLHRVPATRVPKAVESARDRCGLAQVGKRLIRNLSRGYQQRIGIAQAIVHAPPLIVLDEPTAGLDPVQINQIRELIRELSLEQGIILSTHILTEARNLCTRVQIIDQGRMVLGGPVDDLGTQIQTRSLVLRTTAAVNSERISSIDGVTGVESMADNQLRVSFEPPALPSPEIADFIVRSGAGLLEMRAEVSNLEQLFLDLAAADTDEKAHTTR